MKHTGQRRRTALLTALIMLLLAVLPAALAEPSAAGCTAPEASRNNGNHRWRDGGSTEATCTSPATHTWTCGYCKQTVTENVGSALGHSWDSGTVTKAATCTAAGEKTYTCTRCGAKTTESIPMIAHTPASIPAVAATCTAGGKTEGSKCSVCGTILTAQQDTPALGHSWNSGAVTTAATCTAAGVRTYTCTRCGATTTESIAATGHSWDGGKVTASTRCEKDGVRTFTCRNCGTTRTEVIPAPGHRWGEGVVTKEATCQEPGEITYTCEFDPSHTKTEEIPAGEHVWDEGVITKDIGALHDGEITYTCTVCGETRTEVLAALGGNSISSKLRNLPAPVPYNIPTPLMITKHPEDLSILRGSEVTDTLRVEVAGGVPPYSYEWRYKTMLENGLADILPGTGALETVISTAGGIWQEEVAEAQKDKDELAGIIEAIQAGMGIDAELSNPPKQTAAEVAQTFSLNDHAAENGDGPTVVPQHGNALYYCIVTDAEGNRAVSAEARVDYLVRIAEQNMTGIVNVAGLTSLDLTVEAADGIPPYSYAWLVSPQDDHFQSLAGEYSPTLHIELDPEGNNSAWHGLAYICAVQDSTGFTVDSKIVFLNSLAVELPDQWGINPGESDQVTALVYGGAEPYTYKWQRWETILGNSEELEENSPTITIHQKDSLTRTYFLTVQDAKGYQKESQFCYVGPRNLTIVQQPEDGVLEEDMESVPVTVAVGDGTPPYTFTTIIDNIPGFPVEQESPSFTLEANGAGAYTFLIQDAEGRSALSHTGRVSYPEETEELHIVNYTKEAHLSGPGHQYSGTSTVLSVKAAGGTEPYTYTWNYHSGGWDDEYTAVKDAEGDTVKVYPESPRGAYQVIVTDAEGNTASAWPIPVICDSKAPWLTQEPVCRTVSPRDPEGAEMDCRAVTWSGAPDDNLIYEWQIETDGGWQTYTGPTSRGEDCSRIFWNVGLNVANHHIRCVVTDPETGEQSISMYGEFLMPLVHYDTALDSAYSGSCNFYFEGGTPPYTVTVIREREKDAKYSTIVYGDRQYTVSEAYNPGGDMTLTEDRFLLKVRITGMDRWATDCYKQDGFYWYYRRHPWKYTVTVTDAEGREANAYVELKIEGDKEFRKFLDLF